MIKVCRYNDSEQVAFLHNSKAVKEHLNPTVPNWIGSGHGTPISRSFRTPVLLRAFRALDKLFGSSHRKFLKQRHCQSPWSKTVFFWKGSPKNITNMKVAISPGPMRLHLLLLLLQKGPLSHMMDEY
eukprot:scaffold12535_cov98-Cylindrotheca_fusiformis.AAC.4